MAAARAERRQAQLHAADPAAASPPLPSAGAADARAPAADGARGGGAPMPPPAPTRTPQIPDAYLCPISCEIMEDPVVTADGFTYERARIMQVYGLVRLEPFP